MGTPSAHSFEMLVAARDAFRSTDCVAIFGWGSAVQGGYDKSRSDVDIVVVADRACTHDAGEEEPPHAQYINAAKTLGGRFDIQFLYTENLGLQTPPAFRIGALAERRILHPIEIHLIRNESILLHGFDVRMRMPDVFLDSAACSSLGSYLRNIEDLFADEKWRSTVDLRVMASLLMAGARKISYLKMHRLYSKPDSVNLLTRSPIDHERDGALVSFLNELLSQSVTHSPENVDRFVVSMQTILRDFITVLNGVIPSDHRIPALAHAALVELRKRNANR